MLPTGTTFTGKDAVVDFHREFFVDPDWTQELTERALYEADYRDVAGAEPIHQRYPSDLCGCAAPGRVRGWAASRGHHSSEGRHVSRPAR